MKNVLFNRRLLAEELQLDSDGDAVDVIGWMAIARQADDSWETGSVEQMSSREDALWEWGGVAQVCWNMVLFGRKRQPDRRELLASMDQMAVGKPVDNGELPK